MCEKCDAIDEKIAHYKRIVSGISDQLTLERTAKMIDEMELQKGALHPERSRS